MLVYDNIINGNIEETLQAVCEILHKNNDEMQRLEEDLIETCNYIGKHMDITHSLRWVDIMSGVKQFIDSHKVNVDETLELCAKMCIVCKSLHETKQMPIKKLREHVIKYFENKDINAYDHRMFEDILPTPNNESYKVACNIAGTIIYYAMMIENMDFEDKNIFHVSNHIRLCVEYVTRKDVYIENGINRDCDCIWFLWGIFLKLSIPNKQDIGVSYYLFKHRWKPSIKKKRIGILWGSIFVMILARKRISNETWSARDQRIFQQIRAMSPKMMMEIKSKIESDDNKKEDDSMNILLRYTPKAKNDSLEL